VLAQARQVHEPVDRPQQMIGRNVPIQAELVEQGLLRHSALAHHRLASFSMTTLNQSLAATSRPTFNGIVHDKSAGPALLDRPIA
jgi:hypothetical protein